MKRIIISTGGTGGHVIPAQVLYEYLAKKNKVIITSDSRGINYIDKKKYKNKQIHVPKISKNIISYIPFLISFTISIIKSYFYLRKNKTEILISTGGYMSVPICIAAKILNLKIFLFEPNLVLGRANLFLLNYCNKIFTYVKKIKNLPNQMYHKISVIKPLIKKEIYFSKIRHVKKQKNFSILIIGGSQGAKSFDSLFSEDLTELSKKFKIKIFHQTSYKNIKILRNFYISKKINNEVFSYTNNLHKIIKKCDFVITRSGASTINELIFLETPFLAIPFPFSKDDHQYFNANYYVKKNFGWLIRENQITKNFLYKFIGNLIKNKRLLIQKKKNMSKFHKDFSWYKNYINLENLI